MDSHVGLPVVVSRPGFGSCNTSDCLSKSLNLLSWAKITLNILKPHLVHRFAWDAWKLTENIPEMVIFTVIHHHHSLTFFFFRGYPLLIIKFPTKTTTFPLSSNPLEGPGHGWLDLFGKPKALVFFSQAAPIWYQLMAWSLNKNRWSSMLLFWLTPDLCKVRFLWKKKRIEAVRVCVSRLRGVNVDKSHAIESVETVTFVAVVSTRRWYWWRSSRNRPRENTSEVVHYCGFVPTFTWLWIKLP